MEEPKAADHVLCFEFDILKGTQQ